MKNKTLLLIIALTIVIGTCFTIYNCTMNKGEAMATSNTTLNPNNDTKNITDNLGHKWEPTGENLVIAFNSLQENGELWMPVANMTVNNSLLISKNGVKIHGSGNGTKIIFSNGTKLTSSHYPSSPSDTIRFSVGLDNIQLDNFKFTGYGQLELVLGNNTVVKNVSAEYIYCESPSAFRFVLPINVSIVSNLTVTGCNTYKVWWHSFQINAPKAGTYMVENVSFDNCTSEYAGFEFQGREPRGDKDGNWSVGFSLAENYGKANMTIKNMTVKNCVSEYSWESGFHLEDAPIKISVLIENCKSNYNGQKRNNVSVTGQTYFCSGFYSKSTGVTIKDCEANYNTRYGYYIASDKTLINYKGTGNWERLKSTFTPPPPPPPQHPIPTSKANGPYSGYKNYPVAFSSSGSVGGSEGTIVSWSWTFGDGTVSSQQNPTHIYSSSGTFIVTLTVTNNYGQTNTDTTTVIIFKLIPPVADAGGPYSGFVGSPITFNGSRSIDLDGTIVSYVWNFGDSTTGTGVSPTHTYAIAGNYTVILTVTDNQSLTHSNSTTANINVSGPPTISISIDISNIEPLEEENEKTIPVTVFCYHQTVSNIHLEILQSSNLTVTLLSPNITLNPEESMVLLIKIIAPKLQMPENSQDKVGSETIVLRAVGDGNITSNTEQINIKIIEKGATSGFELILILFAIAFVIMWKRKKITK